MIKQTGVFKRTLHTVELTSDLVVVGGGLSGVCCAITAARLGLRVTLIQDRPILGGNASSEVRLWVLGATSHMGNNNRWARETGVIDELLVENLHRNPEGNALIFDTILLEKVKGEKNIRLLLNTAVFEVEKKDADTISKVSAFCSQNSTLYSVASNLFCDASGDGILGFLSGAAFRIGAESRDEFNEKFAPAESYGELLGHSMYFYSKDVGSPVQFVPPSYALKDISKIPRYRNFNAQEHGCKLWWIEYGGRLDTVHETETIKWELWSVIYGVWNYIKNSGLFPEAANLTLEWVGQIPGKRESRRFEGDYMLIQQDIVEQRPHPDGIAYGGWSIDLHPADGVFSGLPGCNQWHSKGIYQIPYRSLYSRNINNLFLAGRIISASHVAFGSTRVMGTSATTGQAVGAAAKLCSTHSLNPKDLLHSGRISSLQQLLLKTGHYIPHIPADDKNDLVNTAVISASSTYILNSLPADGPLQLLDSGAAQMLPCSAGKFPLITLLSVTAIADTELVVSLRSSSKQFNHTPDTEISTITIPLKKGTCDLPLQFDHMVTEPGYYFVCLAKNELVKVSYSTQRCTGILSVFNKQNPAVSNYGRQVPVGDIGMDEFEFWCPERRPNGHNLSMLITPGIDLFQANNIRNGWTRPIAQPNAWVAAENDDAPSLMISWDEEQTISLIQITFDNDYDHPMETVLQGHPEAFIPFCIKDYQVKDAAGNILIDVQGNYQSRNLHHLKTPLRTNKIIIEAKHPVPYVQAAIFEVRCYGTDSPD